MRRVCWIFLNLSFSLPLLFTASLSHSEIITKDLDADGMPDEWEMAYGLNYMDPGDAEIDSDGDFLSNLQEYQSQANPFDIDSDRDGYPDNEDLFPADAKEGGDTDGDGIPDLWEIRYRMDPFTAFDAEQDRDGDTLTARDEYNKGSNPDKVDSDGDSYSDAGDAFPANPDYKLDSDGDGMPDAYEHAHALLFDYPGDAAYDPDGDNLSNLQEFVLGTDPQSSDTDGDTSADNFDPAPLNPAYVFDSDFDGLPDLWENINGQNPYFFDRWEDGLDGDDVRNIQEYLLGTSSLEADTDGDYINDLEDLYPTNSAYTHDMDRDGMPDEFEWKHGLQPSNPMDGAQDMDGDLLSNALEFLLGTALQHPDSDFDRVNDYEDLYPTDRTKALDSDGDRLPDSWEVIYGQDPYFPYDAGEDEDFDGLTSLDEYRLGTDPQANDTDRDGVADGDDLYPTNAAFHADSDEDGLPDAYEQANPPLDPFMPQYPGDDFDHDDFTVFEEFAAGTDINKPDSDGDGMYDGHDAFPTNAAYVLDSDRDGLPDEFEWQNDLDALRADGHEDADDDQLSNLDEFLLGTGLHNPDTDGDNVFDGIDHYPLDGRYQMDEDRDAMPSAYEHQYGLNPHDLSDGGMDRDGDMLNNSREFLRGTNPDHPDTDKDNVDDFLDLFPLDRTKALDSDQDGLPDAWEVIHSLDPYSPEGLDWSLDDDELSNIQEYQLGTNPLQADTDQDGVQDHLDLWPLNAAYSSDMDGDTLPDAYEQQYIPQLQPMFPDNIHDDYDQDGLSTIEEFAAGTNPNLPDTDNDGMMDGEDINPINFRYRHDSDGDGLADVWEMDNGLQPYSALDGLQDTDGDELVNIEEYRLGTDPQNPDSDGDAEFDGYDHFPLNPQYRHDSDRDAMPDEYEYRNGLNAFDTLDGSGDLDGDMLNNSQEFLQGTLLNHPDSDFDGVDDFYDFDPVNRKYADDMDRDGMPDSWEVLNGLDRHYPDAELSLDADLLTNLQEFLLGTDPAQEDSDGDGVYDSEDSYPLDETEQLDTDGDGLPDNYEARFTVLSPNHWDDVNYDEDGDGLNHLQEYLAGTDLHAPDSDGDGVLDGDDFAPMNPEYQFDQDNDGLPDTWEHQHGLIFSQFDSHSDSDGDLLSALAEFTLGTDPDSPDTDGDTLQDGMEHFPLHQAYSFDMDRDGIPLEWEQARGASDNNILDALDDMDGNGLTNLQEFLIEFESGNSELDTDGDGLPDQFELMHGLNPNEPSDALADNDGDSLTNLQEYTAGTHPQQRDTDFDGLDDGFELANGFDPTIDAGEAQADADGDGLTNLQEYLAGTGLNNPDSDGDDVPDGQDAFPLNPGESEDTDQDGIGNIADQDDDNDGLADDVEIALGFDPLLADMDGDGFKDGEDPDVLSEHSPLLRQYLGEAGQYVGFDVVALGDVDGDSQGDYAYSTLNKIGPNSVRGGVVDVISSATGTALTQVENLLADNSTDIYHIGDAVESAGDFNKDGVADVLLGVYSKDTNGSGSGGLLIHSGSDGQLLQTIVGEYAGMMLGYSAKALGDVNGDGVIDYVAGVMNSLDPENKFKGARVYSGLDATTIHNIAFDTSSSNTAPAVAALGDVNGDDVADFAVGVYLGNSSAHLHVYSGSDAAELYVLETPMLLYYRGQLEAIADQNNDGVTDIMLGDPNNDLGATNGGAVLIYSGVNGQLIRAIHGTVEHKRLGYSLAQAGDVDGDGVSDIVASAYGISAQIPNAIYVFSSATGNKIAELTNPESNFGRANIDGLGDINADGFAEVIAGYYSSDANGTNSGMVNIYTFTGDNDQDGMPHTWELAYGLNPFDPSDASLDLDNDGFSNLEEYLMGSSPIDAAVTLLLDETQLLPASVVAINFSSTPPVAYGGSQDRANWGTVSVEDNGATLHMTGNRWQAVDLGYQMTANTVIEFDFRNDSEAEIHGIGFDNNYKISGSFTFKVFGTQNWGRSNYHYTGFGSYQHLVIPAGQYYQISQPTLLFFVNDDDRNLGGDSYFSNVRVYESDQPTEAYFEITTELSWAEVAAALYGSSAAGQPLEEALSASHALQAGEIILQSELPASLLAH